MRIALAQLNTHIGNFEGNYARMAARVEEAKKKKADLVVFSELAVCGYPPRDFLEFGDFVRRCEESVHRLTGLADGIAILVGSPSVNPVTEGKDLHNSAWFLADGEVLDVVHKALLPTYDIFDEYRYFEPNRDYHVVEYMGVRLAITICEDLWNVGNENPLYPDCPMDELIGQEPDVILNLSASPYDHEQADERLGVLRANCERYDLPLLYCNQVGAQTEILFDGGSLVLNRHGKVFAEMPFFREALEVFDLDDLDDSDEWLENDRLQPRDRLALLHDGLVLGVRDYFGKLGFRQAILGLSGGLDSAMTLLLAVRALGADNMRAVLLPSRFSSDHSLADARALCGNLGCSFDEMPIQSAVDAVLDAVTPLFEGKPFDVTEENVQARIRGVFLMALSNKHGYILLNTSNKSEAAVGYGTLYGDMCGGLSVIGDVYKTQLYELAEWINRDREIIPRNTIGKPPSAELRPGQKDTDSLPPYEVLDPILIQYIEHRKGPREIIAMGFDEPTVRRILRLVNLNEYKRHQTPPVLRVSPKAFGMGRRMPIVGKYLS